MVHIRHAGLDPASSVFPGFRRRRNDKELMIILINSPRYTAGYNGAIEHSQGELKGWLRKWKAAAKTIRELALLIENAAHALNHRARRSLFNKNACRVYFGTSPLM